MTAHQYPGCLTRLKWLTALLALIQAGAAWRALNVPQELAAQISLPLPLEFVGGALWALLFALVTFALFRQLPRAFLWAGWSLIVFIGYNMARWILFTQADYDRQRLQFLLLTSTLMLVVCGAFIVKFTRTKSLPTEKFHDNDQHEDR